METIGTINDIILVTLSIGVICTVVLWRHERKAFMKQKTYNVLSTISFLFNMTGGLLCLFMLSIQFR